MKSLWNRSKGAYKTKYEPTPRLIFPKCSIGNIQVCKKDGTKIVPKTQNHINKNVN